MEEEGLERFRGTSTLSFIISKTEQGYLDVEVFYIRYTFICLKLFMIVK